MILALAPVTLLDVILGIFVLFVIGSTLFYYYRLRPTARIIKSNILDYTTFLKEDSRYNVEIQKTIERLRIDVAAAKVTICRFHNGGNYVNGLPMKKFSMVFETEGIADEESMMDRCFALLVTRYPMAFSHLATMEEYCVSETNESDTWVDKGFRRDMMKYKMQSSNMFLIKQFDGSEEGFITVSYRTSHVMDKMERTKVKDVIPRIMGLMNMSHEHLSTR